MTEPLFQADAYKDASDSVIVSIRDNTVELESTVFYPTGGGQPGDTGRIIMAGQVLDVVDTRKGEQPSSILHVLAEPQDLAVGSAARAELDWPRRYRLMRMHTCLHLLCKAVDGVVTGGQIGDGKGRLDFDIPEATLDKEPLAEQLNAWIAEDHAVAARWIDAAELDTRPELVRTMSVKPPRTGGRVRLVEIEGLDLQACGGTHVRSTSEIGKVRVAKIEKKGRQNRRVQVVFDET